MKTIKLNNGIEIPVVGLGVFQSNEGKETKDAIKWALGAGYRHIDTAVAYNNEKSVGEAIKESDLAREDIFLTTKLWNGDVRLGNTRQAFMKSLENLQTDYIDLYLIHWPVDGFEDAWREMEKLYNEKRIKAIGVSNFHKHHLDDLSKVLTIKPAINQIESNPIFNNQELIDYCQSENIQVEVWSPLGGTGSNIFSNEVLLKLAEKYGKSVAQIIIKWHIQRNVIVLPKSVHQNRIISNYDVFDFEISCDDMQIINNMNKNQRSGADPDNFNF